MAHFVSDYKDPATGPICLIPGAFSFIPMRSKAHDTIFGSAWHPKSFPPRLYLD